MFFEFMSYLIGETINIFLFLIGIGLVLYSVYGFVRSDSGYDDEVID